MCHECLHQVFDSQSCLYGATRLFVFVLHQNDIVLHQNDIAFCNSVQNFFSKVLDRTGIRNTKKGEEMEESFLLWHKMLLLLLILASVQLAICLGWTSNLLLKHQRIQKSRPSCCGHPAITRCYQKPHVADNMQSRILLSKMCRSDYVSCVKRSWP